MTAARGLPALPSRTNCHRHITIRDLFHASGGLAASKSACYFFVPGGRSGCSSFVRSIGALVAGEAEAEHLASRITAMFVQSLPVLRLVKTSLEIPKLTSCTWAGESSRQMRSFCNVTFKVSRPEIGRAH